MGAAFVELPMPSWWGQKQSAVSDVENIRVQEPEIQAVEEKTEPVTSPLVQKEDLPQGVEAAELAAASKPRKRPVEQQSHLPAPLVGSGPFSPLEFNAANGIPLLPQPEPLGAPLVSAGVILPQPENASPERREESIWNILDLKSLPIPGLGSAQVANAAALDMPVPPVPKQSSPFTPAEQLAPTGGRDGSLPNMAQASRENSTVPLLPRQSPFPETNALQPINPERPLSAPAPVITEGKPMNSIHTQAQELARQQQDLLVLRQQMDQRLKDLQSAEDKMKDMLQQAKDVEDKKVKSLVQMYANMKPRMAAQAMENMDERVAVRILAGMAPKQSGEILTYTNPAKTAKFTEMLTRIRMGE